MRAAQDVWAYMAQQQVKAAGYQDSGVPMRLFVFQDQGLRATPFGMNHSGDHKVSYYATSQCFCDPASVVQLLHLVPVSMTGDCEKMRPVVGLISCVTLAMFVFGSLAT